MDRNHIRTISAVWSAVRLIKGSIHWFGAVAVCAVISFSFTNVSAQEMVFGTYDIGSGLASNYIIDIAQDQKGFLWIGNDQGVAVYDGRTFRNFDSADGLEGGMVIKMHRHDDGGVWVLTYQGHIARILPHKVESHLARGEIDKQVIDFLPASNNRMWIMLQGKVQLVDLDQQRKVIWETPLLTVHGGSLFPAGRDSVLVPGLHATHLLTVNDRVILEKLPVEAMPFEQALQMHIIAKNGSRILLTNARGTYLECRLSNGVLKPVFGFTGILMPSAAAWYKGRWIIVSEANGVQALSPVESGLAVNLSDISNLEGSMFRDVLVDRDSVLWIGGFGTGLYKLRSEGFETVSPRPALRLAASGGWSFAFTETEVIAQPYGTDNRVRWQQPEEAFNALRNVYFDSLSGWWYGSFRLLHGPFKSPEASSNAIKNRKITHGISGILTDDSGQLIYATYGDGIHRIDNNGYDRSFGESPVLKSLMIEDMKRFDRQIWFTTFGSGIGLIESDSVRMFTIHDGLASNYVYSVARFGDSVFAATGSGLSVSHFSTIDWKSIKPDPGLPARMISVFERKNKIFAVSENSLFEIAGNRLVKQEAFPIVHASRERITQAIYLPDNDVLWLNTTVAFRSQPMFRIDINGQYHVPVLTHTDVTLDDGSTMNLPEFPVDQSRLPAGVKSVKLILNLLQYTEDIEPVLYARVNGGIPFSLQQGELFLQNPAPGTYLLDIGVDPVNKPDDVLTLKFSIDAPLWQHPGAIFLLLILVTLIIYLSAKRLLALNYQRRLRVLELERSIQHERHRIARELHDSVGANLTYIITTIDDSLKTSAPNHEERLKLVSGFAKSTMTQLRETIWAINKESVSAHQLADKIHSWALSFLNGQPALVIMQEGPNNDVRLSPGQTLNIYRILQESIQNVKKHAQADTVSIGFVTDEKTLNITVTDNGLGFSDNGSFTEGYGLANMRSRAEEIGALFQISSKPGNTTVHLTIDLTNTHRQVAG
jgi:signal transduction histidine kinase